MWNVVLNKGQNIGKVALALQLLPETELEIVQKINWLEFSSVFCKGFWIPYSIAQL